MATDISSSYSTIETEEFSVCDPLLLQDKDIWSTPSRHDDIQTITKAFDSTRESLHFNDSYSIEETLSTVGPQEHLDHEINSKMETMKIQATESIPLGDELPHKVMGIIQGVIDKASEGQTSTFLASQNLETTGPAYEYGRQAMCDMFQLTLAGREKLKECDDKLKEAIQFRLNTEMESAESAMEQCYALLSEAEKESKIEQSKLADRYTKEDELVTMDQLKDIHKTALDELAEETNEHNIIYENCMNDIHKIDDAMRKLEEFAESSRQSFIEREAKRNSQLVANRKRQEELRNELLRLEEEEKELESLCKDEQDCQKIADSSYKETQTKMDDWKQKIDSLSVQTNTALHIIRDMNMCTELILSDAMERKSVWTSELFGMEIQMLLQYRDALLAKICLHKMARDDCQDNLKETHNDLNRCETDIKKWSYKGFKSKVANIREEIQSLQEVVSEMQMKLDRHNSCVEESENELSVINKTISDKKPSITLHSSQSLYESFRYTLKKVYEKEDIALANICSNRDYNI